MILSRKRSFYLLSMLLDEFYLLDLFPVIGAEIEFYLTSFYEEENNSLWKAKKLDLDFPIEREKGDNQFEIKFVHHNDIFLLIEEILERINKISTQAIKQQMIADFQAKPFMNQPGSALHIHLHLENSSKKNLYIKEDNKDSKFLLNSIGGLCSTMIEHMLVFAPYKKAYLRYIENSIDSPSKVCWGENNRSAAIRIPLSSKLNRRLEHRVACANSSPIEVIYAILFAVMKGIKEDIQAPKKIYGNAFLEQYDYPLLPKDYTHAKRSFKLNIR